MPMHNLIECSYNYSKTSGTLWQYCKDIPAANNNPIANFPKNNLTDSFNIKVKVKDCNVMINGENFFDQPIKNNK